MTSSNLSVPPKIFALSFSFMATKLYYLQMSRNFHIILFRFSHFLGTFWPCQRRHLHPCISHPIQNHSGFYYYALSLSVLWGYEERNERLCFYCWSVNSVLERTQYRSSRFLRHHYLHCQNLEKPPETHFYSGFKR